MDQDTTHIDHEILDESWYITLEQDKDALPNDRTIHETEVDEKLKDVANYLRENYGP
jgi:hypothetical protein